MERHADLGVVVGDERREGGADGLGPILADRRGNHPAGRGELVAGRLDLDDEVGGTRPGQPLLARPGDDAAEDPDAVLGHDHRLPEREAEERRRERRRPCPPDRGPIVLPAGIVERPVRRRAIGEDPRLIGGQRTRVGRGDREHVGDHRVRRVDRFLNPERRQERHHRRLADADHVDGRPRRRPDARRR